ncbi:hypothetical protein PLCT2_01926 [Planctomycetaceae bacterium]|nr:hypothetical protein PLCT2_01926 [Planctomycetaceae bacterium]
MNLRLDKVVRISAPGVKRVYSLVLTDEGLYLIQTGHAGTLKHYRVDAGRLLIDRADDRGVRDLQAGESRLDSQPLDALVKIKDNYFIRLEAIEDVELRPNSQEPEMWIGVTGSEHHLFFPFATEDEVQTLQRALSKWLDSR